MLKKVVLVALLSLFATSVNWAYSEIDCSSDPVFGQYSCNQCFDGWEVSQRSNISFLDDIWVNDTTNRKIMYKEEQTMPVMNALNWAVLTKNPNDDTFWEFTSEFESLKNDEFDGYVLPAWQSVSWLKSSLWASYLVESIPSEWQNVWVLVFDIMSHNILESGEIAMNDAAHKECVLYKAWQTVVTPVVQDPVVEEVPEPQPEEMTQVETWPELYFLVLMMSFLLAFGVMNRKSILEKIRK